MKLKYNFVTNKVADMVVAVAVGEDVQKFDGFIKMNDTGAYIFNMLKNDVTEDEITAAMDYGTDADVRASLCRYIDQNGYNPEIKNYINSRRWI